MKRKIFSTLLFGALAFVSLSTVTSCKDYDDDINDLSAKQASMLAQIESLQSSVSSNATAINEVKGTANDALNKAIAASTNADEAKTKAQNAIDAAKEAATAAATAQAGADAAAQKAQAALDAIGDETKGLVKRVADLEGKIAGLEAMKDELDDLKEDVAKCASKEDLAKLQAKFDSLNGWFNKVFAMVTNVELFGTYTGSAATFFNTEGKAPNLNLMYGTVGEDSKFGDEVNWATIPTEAFAKGTAIKADEGIIVRVNPVNADLSTSKVLFINSKGESLSDFVEVKNAERYNEVITRGTNVQSGLWNLNVQLKDGINVDEFKKLLKNDDGDILFAVAVNNTDTVTTYGGDNRWVASTYDLTLASDPYKATKTLFYTVDGKKVTEIHNRWNGGATTGDKENAPIIPPTSFETAVEYTWATSTDDYPTPATGIVVENNTPMNVKTETATDENRANVATLPVAVNVPFTVKLAPAADNAAAKEELGKVKSYYVVLDKNFAFESAPSEWEAWSKYSYDGLNTIVKNGDELKITVKSAGANGDIIGFRLFAVNYDGTLVDPDGRAFYVKVGNDTKVVNVAGDVVATAAGTPPASVTFKYESDFIAVSGLANFDLTDNSIIIAQSAFDEDGVKSLSGAKMTVTFYDGDKQAATNMEDAKFVKVSFNDPTKFADGETFAATYKATNTEGRVVNTINVNVKKVMPTKAPYEVAFKTNQLNADGSYTCYVEPKNASLDIAWNAAASSAYKDMVQAVNGLKDNHFAWTIENAAIKDKKWADKLEVIANANGTAYPIQIAETTDDDVARLSALVDNKTAHASSLDYIYPNISLHKKDGNWDTDYSYSVNVPAGSVNIIFACELDPSLQTWAFIKTTAQGGDTPVAAQDVNWIKYGSEKPAEGVNVNASGVVDNSDNQVEIADFIKGKNAHTTSATFNRKFAGCNLYVGTYECHLTSDGGGVGAQDEYYTVKFNGTKFEFKQKSSATEPTADVPSHLTVKAKDAFGHETVIMNLPFTVKK